MVTHDYNWAIGVANERWNLSEDQSTWHEWLSPQPGVNAAGFILMDGTSGFLVAARGAGTRNADDYAGTVIAKISGDCKGQFLSGKQAVPAVDGSVIRKIFTTCKMANAIEATLYALLMSLD